MQGEEARPRPVIEAEWRPVWEAIARLEDLPREGAEYATLRAELQRTAVRRESAPRRRSDRAFAFRSRVLAAQIARLDGLEPRRVRDPGIVLDFLAGEALLAAQVTLAGPMRTEASVRALDEADPDDIDARAGLVREVIEDDIGGLRFDLAERLARAWTRRSEEVESGVLCARVLRANGRLAEATDLLARLDRPDRSATDRMQLALERAREARAREDQEAALDALGTALATGSTEAALLLARDRIERGETGPALALARAFLDDAPESEEARRVWVLALLPPDGETARLAPGEPRGP